MGNFLNMKSKGGEATDDSDDEVDITALNNSYVIEEMPYEVDAAITPVPSVQSERPKQNSEFSIIAAELSEYEKISLIFLLNEDAEESLILMKGILENNGSHNIFPVNFNLDNSRDKNKLIEALCIIQNYYILRTYYGKSKSQLIDQYKPLQRCTSLYVKEIKKCLYRLFEDMTAADNDEFLKALRVDHPRFEYMEMYFTYLETIDFITSTDFSNIEKALGQIKKEAFYYDFLAIEERRHIGFNNQMNVDRARASSISEETINFRNDTGYGDSKLERYHINENHPGVVIIIENENFYSEPDPALEDQIVKTSDKLMDRKGSKCDTERLIRSFKRFNFKIISKSDLTHEDMLKFVKDVAHNQFKREDSSIFVCLMSHGVIGKVVASNSIAVAIDDIKKQLNSPNLEGKPKVLIIQSCQGEEILTLTTDGVSAEEPETQLMTRDRRVPPTLDYLEIWSTVPGYASIRDVTKGTWFIQNLCNVLDSSGEGSNMYEICIQTRNKLLEEKWTVQKENKTIVRVMVCETRDTLSKLLLLPRVVNN